MKVVLLGASLVCVIAGISQTTNPVLASEAAQFGITPVAGNPLPSMAWFGIAAVAFAGYLSMQGGR